MAYEAGVAPRLVRQILARLNAALPAAITQVIHDKRFLPNERAFLQDKVLPIIAERQEFIAEATRSRPFTLPDLLHQKELDRAVLERLTQLAQ